MLDRRRLPINHLRVGGPDGAPISLRVVPPGLRRALAQPPRASLPEGAPGGDAPARALSASSWNRTSSSWRRWSERSGSRSLARATRPRCGSGSTRPSSWSSGSSRTSAHYSHASRSRRDARKGRCSRRRPRSLTAAGSSRSPSAASRSTCSSPHTLACGAMPRSLSSSSGISIEHPIYSDWVAVLRR